MQTLAIFPHLLSYPLLAYMLLRLVLIYGFGKILWLRRSKKYSFIAFLEVIPSALLLIGLWSQIALLGIIAFLIIEKFVDKKESIVDQNLDFKIVLVVIAISLMFLGPGSFSIDLPL